MVGHRERNTPVSKKKNLFRSKLKFKKLDDSSTESVHLLWKHEINLLLLVSALLLLFP